MNKSKARIVARAAEPMIGSSSYSGVDVSSLYIDMLCEKFRDRGIRRVDNDVKKKTSRSYVATGVLGEEISPYDPKYRNLKVDGKSCMSSDDFAAYYKDLRGYKLPKHYSRDQREYGECGDMASNVQESGKSPKKALWLAVRSVVKKKARDLASCVKASELERLSAEWFPVDKKENRLAGRKKKMPRGTISLIAVVTLSLLLIVCSSVMVSRSSGEVSKLEYKIEVLEGQRNELKTKLEVKNDLLEIQKIAVEEYGMISGDYAASRYVDVTDDEVIEEYGDKNGKESLISKLIKAIGFKK